jgi:hypothetical protein
LKGREINIQALLEGEPLLLEGQGIDLESSLESEGIDLGSSSKGEGIDLNSILEGE